MQSSTNVTFTKAQLVAALIAGEVADRVTRRKPIRIGIIIGILAIVALWVAMFAPFATENDHHAYWVATFGLFMWGAFRGVTLAPLDALFADSIPTAKRAKYQVRKYVATLAGATMGPLLAVILFKNFGDTWTKNELRVVIAAGTAFAVVPLISLLWFHDRHALDENASGPLLQTMLDKHDVTSYRIRMLCFAADLLGGLASGMSIKFFPLFFRDQTNLTPGEVNTVTIVTTFSMIVGSLSSQKLAKRFGRMPTIVVYKAIGIILLFIMALRKSLWSDWRIIVPIYVVRTVLMNATAPLHKSVLMDHCGKDQRARWSALDSVVTFGWSGSALLGGILADKHGFGYTFLITAVLQTVGFVCLCLLACLVDDNACETGSATVVPAANSGTRVTFNLNVEESRAGSHGSSEEDDEEAAFGEALTGEVEYRLMSEDGSVDIETEVNISTNKS